MGPKLGTAISPQAWPVSSSSLDIWDPGHPQHQAGKASLSASHSSCSTRSLAGIRNVALRPEAITQLVDWSLAPHKMSLVVNTCNPCNWRVKARRGVQGYPGLHRELEASLRYMRSLLSSGEGAWRRGGQGERKCRGERGEKGGEERGREGKREGEPWVHIWNV